MYSVRTLFSRQEEASLQSFLEFFGEKITNYIILVFTGGDELEDNDETLAEHSGSGCPQPLKTSNDFFFLITFPAIYFLLACVGFSSMLWGVSHMLILC